jgi:hypothetical protein
MPHVTLRTHEGVSSETDLVVSVQEKTFEYLRTTVSPQVRVSAYLDRDCENVEDEYAELFIEGADAYRSVITRVIPGSRTRTNIELPGPMFSGEQLTLEVERRPV